jgi:predicted dehydrogenase
MELLVGGLKEMNTSKPNDTSEMKRPVSAIVVGAGNRASQYANCALGHPDGLNIVGVVDPDEIMRNRLGDRHCVPSNHRFTSIDELLQAGLEADAVINGTMDALHVELCVDEYSTYGTSTER